MVFYIIILFDLVYGLFVFFFCYFLNMMYFHLLKIKKIINHFVVFYFKQENLLLLSDFQ